MKFNGREFYFFFVKFIKKSKGFPLNSRAKTWVYRVSKMNGNSTFIMTHYPVSLLTIVMSLISSKKSRCHPILSL